MTLSDLEICKYLAKVEGYNLSADGLHLINAFYTFDPLSNSKEAKAFCLDLIFKYKLEIKHGIKCSRVRRAEVWDGNINKGICNAAIESVEFHKSLMKEIEESKE